MRVGPSTPTVPANSPSTRYGASTIAQSRSSSSSFSDPMLTLTPWSSKLRTSETTTTWCSSSSSRCAALSAVANDPCSAMSRLVPPTYSISIGRSATSSPNAARRRLRKLIERAAVPQSLEGGRRRADLRLVQDVGQFQRVLLDGAVREHRDREHDAWVERHQLHAADLGDLGLQVLERPVRRLEGLRPRPALGDAQRALAGEVVDEVAVTQIRRDSARRGVRLGDVSLALEHGHVVAHGRARHTELAGTGDPLGPDRLRRLDVLLDHG